MRLPDWSSIFRLAAQGGGVCLGRTPLINDFVRSGTLGAPWPLALRSTRAYYLIQSAAARQDLRVQCFVTWLRDQAAKEADFEAELIQRKRVVMGASKRPDGANVSMLLGSGEKVS